MLLKIFKVLGGALLIVISILLVNTFRFQSRQLHEQPASLPRLNADDLAQPLAQAIRFRTISTQDPAEFQGEEFLKLHEYLEQSFPLVHATLECEKVADYSLLYTWKGSNSSLKPILLMSHMDVVPVEDESKWTHPPFEGRIADGFVWGRGTLDDKSGVLAILQAVELLLQSDFQPQRTVYLAFGHDEERGGTEGAAHIAALLQSRRVQVEYILDEGGAIVEGMVPGVPKPVAMIGISEKGYANLELTVEVPGGHSSMPPRRTAIGILSAAIHKLEENQMSARIPKTLEEMFSFLGSEMPLAQQLMFANLWLFRPVVRAFMISDPKSASWVRTSTAPTIIQGGIKENVLPSNARALINFRILPGDSVDSVRRHVVDTIDDPGIKVSIAGDHTEPSSQSDPNSEGFRAVQRTISQMDSGVVAAPYMLSGGTDSRHYAPISPHVFRFLPIRVKTEDLERIHGIDERISVESYKDCVVFFRQLLLNASRI